LKGKIAFMALSLALKTATTREGDEKYDYTQ
jgi:hypothetical protein